MGTTKWFCLRCNRDFIGDWEKGIKPTKNGCTAGGPDRRRDCAVCQGRSDAGTGLALNPCSDFPTSFFPERLLRDSDERFPNPPGQTARPAACPGHPVGESTTEPPGQTARPSACPGHPVPLVLTMSGQTAQPSACPVHPVGESTTEPPGQTARPSACPDLPEARNYTAGSRRIRTEIAQPIATQAAQPTNGEYLPKSTPKPNIRPKGWSFS